MLCLTRQIGASIVIGDDITVTVLEVKGRQVRIGIDAPRDVPVAREELLERNRLADEPDETLHPS